MARPSLDRNVKFKRLVVRLGIPRPYVRGLLETLWDVANENGDPTLGSPDHVEAAAEWPGKVGDLFAALRDLRLIDKTGRNTWSVHDYWDHAPEYVRKRRHREQQRQLTGARLAGKCPDTDGTTAPNGGHRPLNGKTPAPAPAPALISEDGDRSSEAEIPKTGSLVRPNDRTRADEIEWRVSQTWEFHLKAWKRYYLATNGREPSVPPTLTAKIRKAIRDALKVYDSHLLAADQREQWLQESKVRASGIGLYLSTWHNGTDQRNDKHAGGKEFLEHWRPWVPQRGKPDPVETFAELYFARREERRSA